MNVHIVMHEDFESPAAIEVWARSKHCGISYTKLYAGDRFPTSFDFDLLVVMGGPQSPATTLRECPHFDASKEIAFIKQAIDRQKRVLGVCLGAQLIGEALGARFEHSPNREIGTFPLELTEQGRRDPLCSAFPDEFEVAHWHGDMPGLTQAAQVLANSKGCPRQVVRYTPKVYGFQCHFEFTPEAVEAMIRNSSAELRAYADLPYVQTPERMRRQSYGEMNDLLFQFLERLTADFQ